MLGANGNTSATESVGSPGLPGLAGENGDVGAMGSAGPAALSWTGATRALGTCDAPGKRVSFSISKTACTREATEFTSGGGG